MGENENYADIASGVIHAQDEVDQWTKALRSAGARIPSLEQDDYTAYLAPLRAWQTAVQELNGFRRRGGEGDYEVSEEGLVLSNSPVSKALLWTLKSLGSLPAHYAAVSAGLSGGEIAWEDDNAFKGIVGYERLLQAMIDVDQRIKLENPTKRLADLTDRLGGLQERATDLDKAITEKLAEIDMSLLADRMQQQQKVKKFVADSDQQRDRIEKQAAAGSAEISKTVGAGKEAVENWLIESRTQFEINRTESSEALRQALSEGKQAVENWVAANIEQKQLAKPARLWAGRSKVHGRRAGVLQWWAIAVGISGLILSGILAYLAFRCSDELFSSAIVPGKAKLVPGTLKPTFHYQLIFTGVVTLAWLTMYLWAMRVLVRLYTTEHHLAIDASARGAMNDTYIGLVAAGAANEKDRPIVLAALFRPVQDGIVKDDGPPGIAPATVLSGLLGGGSKGS